MKNPKIKKLRIFASLLTGLLLINMLTSPAGAQFQSLSEFRRTLAGRAHGSNNPASGEIPYDLIAHDQEAAKLSRAESQPKTAPPPQSASPDGTGPANDDFASGQVISGLSGTVNTINAEASKEMGEPNHAGNSGGRSVWYRYTAPGSGSLTITTLNSNFDTLLAVYVGSAVNNLQPIASSDDYPTHISNTSAVTIGTQTGVVYHIAVDGYNGLFGTATGTIALNWSLANSASNDNFANALTLASPNPQSGSLSGTNVGASKEAGEPNHHGEPGGKSVWFKWTAPGDFARVYNFTFEGSRSASGSSSFNGVIAIYTGSSVNSLTTMTSWGGTDATCYFKATPGQLYYIAVDGKDSGSGAQAGTINISWGVRRAGKATDFDRDGRADITVFRPINGAWYSLDSSTNALRAVQFGTNGDKPLYADINGDRRTDYQVFRPDTGSWYIVYHNLSNLFSLQWGLNTDIPVSGNWLSNTATTIGVFRPSNGMWYIYNGIGGVGYSEHFGQQGDIPVQADYDGDGFTDLAVFRPSNGTWYIRRSTDFAIIAEAFGTMGDKPVAADYDNDGLVDIAVYRPSNGGWYVRQSTNGQMRAEQFGIASDIPVPADYSGDNRADFVVYRPSQGTWYTLNNLGAVSARQFGTSLDIPATTGRIIP